VPSGLTAVVVPTVGYLVPLAIHWTGSQWDGQQRAFKANSPNQVTVRP